MRGLFVSGNGTDLGKTYVSAAIARELTQKSLNLCYYKAAVSGADSIAQSDAGYVIKHGGIKQDLSSSLSYLYKNPLSPHLAARIEGNFVDLVKIKNDFNALRSSYDYVLSEGAGGIVCPVVYEDSKKLFYEDILKELGLGVVIVADAGLGTINHTVLSVAYLQSHNFKIKGIILNHFANTMMHNDNLVMIEELCHVKVIATLKKGESKLSLRYKPMEEYFDEC